MAEFVQPRFVIPKKIHLYLKRLRTEYDTNGEAVLAELLGHARVEVQEGVDYDNWNGGIHGHNVLLHLSAAILGKVPLQKQDAITNRLRDDLKLASSSVENEYVNSVFLEMDDEGVEPTAGSTTRLAATDTPSKPWKSNTFRAFISHRDTNKMHAHSLASSIEGYGISSFVAHDAIEPDKEWLVEIVKSLRTMDFMVALLSDDFYDSPWTNQEIGYALGKDVPVIVVKIGAIDPRGFMSPRQAIKTSPQKLFTVGPTIFDFVQKHFGNSERLRSALVSSFCESGSFNDATQRFDQLTRQTGYTKNDADRIIKAFEINPQIKNCWYLQRQDRLVGFLSTLTSVTYEINGGKIVKLPMKRGEESPF